MRSPFAAGGSAERERVTRPVGQHLRTIALDSGWTVAAVVFSLFGTRGAGSDSSGYRTLDPLAYVLCLLAPLLLVAVRVWPRAIMAATTVLVAVYLARDYPGGPIYLVTMAAAAVLGWRASLRRSLPSVVLAGLALVGAAAVHLDHSTALRAMLTLLAWALVPVVPWALTSLVGISRAATRQAAIELHRHQVDDERVRMAREVHDVVGHSLAVISMQAGVALYVAERRPDQARVALEAIARSSRDALADLRGTLAIFRGDSAPVAPNPGIADLPALVADFAATGQQVQLSVTGEHGRLPATHDLATYRVVQESLTNAARHAGSAPTHVQVSCGPASVVIDIRDDGPGAATTGQPGAPQSCGSGVMGMRERCAALGGTLQAGPRRPRGWRVQAELPYRQRSS